MYHAEAFFFHLSDESELGKYSVNLGSPFHWLKCCLLYLEAYCGMIAWAPPNPLQECGLVDWASVRGGRGVLHPGDRQMQAASIAAQKGV